MSAAPVPEAKTFAPSRWAHAQLVEMFEQQGNVIHERRNGTVETSHEPFHGSKSGTPVVIWPDEQRYFCRSCKERGDAATFLQRLRGVGYKEAAQELTATYGPPSPNGATPAKAPPSRDDLIPAIATDILKTNRFAQDQGGKLWHYVSGAYRPGGEGVIQRAVKAYVIRHSQEGWWRPERAKAVVEYIRVDAPELWERPPLGTLNFENGLLDLNSGVLRGHTPDWLSPVQFPVRFDPRATCPEWEAFIAQTFPEDAHALAWEIVAFALDHDPSIQKAVLLTGEGSNGKSVFLTGLTALLGKRNTSALSLHKLEQDRFAVARLLGKVANISADLPSHDLQSTSVFKGVLGGDALAAEYKYRDSFEFTPFCRLLFSANHLPRSADASFAFFRRWVVVPFGRTFEGDAARPRVELDAALADPGELSGLLNKALAARPRLRSQGFSEPASVRDAWLEFRGTTDPFAIFLDEMTVDDPNAFVGKDALRHAYYAVCDQKSVSRPAAKAVGQALKRLRPNITDAQRTIAGKTVWAWLGIGLKGERGGPGSRDSLDSLDSPNCWVTDEGDAGETGKGTIQKSRESRESREAVASPAFVAHICPLTATGATCTPSGVFCTTCPGNPRNAALAEESAPAAALCPIHGVDLREPGEWCPLCAHVERDV